MRQAEAVANNWILGQVGGITVDRRHIWVSTGHAR